ncbi:MAG: hypothetical protein IH602_00255 [Bryobacteraceae bacterium]|nr:hypothetical protein [Bryobacteraceae bacterium]
MALWRTHTSSAAEFAISLFFITDYGPRQHRPAWRITDLQPTCWRMRSCMCSNESTATLTAG